MSFKKIMLSGVAALAITSVSAFGAVSLENDGTGDYLLLPATYSNEAGWMTDLKVVNTNTTTAIVARVVIRNGHDSSELFDFPLYLTPGDAWMGTLKIGTGDNADRIVVATNDDSSMLWAGESGTIISAKDAPLELTVQNVDPKLDVENQTTSITDGRRSTYVEVFGLAAYDAATVAAAKGIAWSEGQALDKTAFFEYARNVESGTPKTQLVSPGVLNDLYNDPFDVDNESLLAKEVIVNSTGSLNMAMNAVAMGGVSTAARTIAVIGTATTMNSMSNTPAASIDEMRALLAKDKVYMMNEGDADGKAYYQRLHLTDPMKKYTDEQGELDTYYSEDVLAPQIIDYYYTYNHNGRNMEEKLACAPEGSNTDFSNDGFAATDCVATKVYYEVERRNISPDSSDLPYFFPAGGYIQVDLDTNTSVVPTSFGSTGIANYYIANQYDEGTVVEAE